MLSWFYWKKDRDVLIFLTQQNLINSSLEHINIASLREKAKEIFFAKKPFPDKILAASQHLQGREATIEYLYKSMVFFHSLIQAAGKEINQGLGDVISKQINKAVSRIGPLLHEQLKIKRKALSVQLEPTADMTSKWKVPRALSLAQSLDEGAFENKQNSRSINNQPFREQCEDSPPPPEIPKGKLQFLAENVIRPYAAYLHKLISWRIHYYQELTDSGKKNLQMTEIWAVLNVYRSMIGVTNSFLPAMRYFDKQLIGLVLTITELFDTEIKDSYCMICEAIKQRVQKINKKYQEAIVESSGGKYLKLKEIEEQFQLKNLREVIKQMTIINDCLFGIYRNKYLHKILFQKQILVPSVMVPDNHFFQVVFAILEIISLEEKSMLKDMIRNSRSSSIRRSNTATRDASVENFSEMCKNRRSISNFEPKTSRVVKNTLSQKNNEY